jgi:hypothetical protein
MAPEAQRNLRYLSKLSATIEPPAKPVTIETPTSTVATHKRAPNTPPPHPRHGAKHKNTSSHVSGTLDDGDNMGVVGRA